MAAMAPVEEQAGAGPPPRLPTLPVSDGRAMMEAIVDDRVAASGASTDRLPVVELRPFMNQEWRPSRSLPDYYDRSATSMSNNSRRGDGGSYPDPASLGLLNQKATEFGSKTSLSGERRDALRYRMREGKPVDTSHDGMFVTPMDREQTTIQEMHAKAVGAATGPSNQTASIVRSLSEGELMRLREMRVQGRRMENLPPKLSMFYVSPWEYYRMQRSYEIPLPTEPGAAAHNAVMDELEQRYPALENVHIDDNIYDTFDRSNTLPSIRVTNVPTRRKRHRKPRQASATSSSAPGSAVAPPAYRLGVANSLDVLRHFGRPARVETHLTMHLKHTLNQLRRTHDSQATLQSAAAGAGLLGHAPGFGVGRPVGLRTSSTPTYGETMLRVGIQANNAPKISDRNIRAALPSSSAPDVLSRSTTHLRNEIYGQLTDVEQPEHITSGHPHSSGGTGYEQLPSQPLPPPSTAELLNGTQVLEEDGSVSMTPRKSRRSREPQDPTDISPRDHHSSSSSTKSPRTKSRRSKSRRSEEAKSQRETPRTEGTASPRKAGAASSVTFQDEQLDSEQLSEQVGTAHSQGSDMLTSTHSAQAAADGRSSMASRSETGATPVHIPHSSDGSRNEAHPEGNGDDYIHGDSQAGVTEHDAERQGDVSAQVKIGPNGDIQVGGNSVGVIKIGTDGALTIGDKPIAIVKVGANGNIEIHPCTSGPRTVSNDEVGDDNEDNFTSEPNGNIDTEGDTTDIGDSSEVLNEIVSSGDIISAPATTPVTTPVQDGTDVDPHTNAQSVPEGDTVVNMEVDPTTETIEEVNEARVNIGGGDIEPGSDIAAATSGDIIVGPHGHLQMAGKNLGTIQFGNNGEIRLGGRTIAAIATAADGNIAIKTTAEVRGSSRLSRVSFSPESTGGSRSGRVSTAGAEPDASMGIGAAENATEGMGDADAQENPIVESSSDLNNNTGDSVPAHGMKSPGGTDYLQQGPQERTPAPGQSPGEGSPSTPTHTTPAADAEGAADVPGGIEQRATPPGGHVGIRKMQTKSAASKASSQGYRGDDVYLTSWDQKTETESIRPETVLTVREEGE